MITWKCIPHYWFFVRGIHRSRVDSPRKGTVMQSFLCRPCWTNNLTNNLCETPWRSWDVTVMLLHLQWSIKQQNQSAWWLLMASCQFANCVCYAEISHGVFNSRDLIQLWESWFEISPQSCCGYACFRAIGKFKPESRGSETLRDLTLRQLIAYWMAALLCQQIKGGCDVMWHYRTKQSVLDNKQNKHPTQGTCRNGQ